jgi:hypothetical protein
VEITSIPKPSLRYRVSKPKKRVIRFAIDELMKYIEHGFLISDGRVKIRILKIFPNTPEKNIGIGTNRLN